jgi:hypothetical protein
MPLQSVLRPGVTEHFETAQPLAQCGHHRVGLGQRRAVNPAAVLDRTDGLMVPHDCMPFEAAWREKRRVITTNVLLRHAFSLFPSNHLLIAYYLAELQLRIIGVPSSSDDSLATRFGPIFCAARESALRVRLGQVKNTNGSIIVR